MAGTKDASNTSSSSRKSLKDLAEDKLKSGNASQLGDPVSLKAETADSSPTDSDKGAAGGKGKSLKELAESKLESGNASMLGDPVSLKAEAADSEPTENDRGAMSTEERRKRGSKI